MLTYKLQNVLNSTWLNCGLLLYKEHTENANLCQVNCNPNPNPMLT